MFDWIASPEGWIALATLIGLEVVLGIDNIIFVSILVSRLPEHQREQARKLGLGFAMLARLGLLFSLVWIMGLIEPLFEVLGNAISGRDLILILGGLFLLAKSSHEIHAALEIDDEGAAVGASTFMSVLIQIAVLDVVFSFDSVITAVGLVKHISMMAIAIIISVVVMLLAAKSIGEFVEENPTIKILALSFLILIGTTLIAEGLDMHIPKGYVYFAMAFSVAVEMINIRVRANKQSLKLKKKITS